MKRSLNYSEPRLQQFGAKIIPLNAGCKTVFVRKLIVRASQQIRLVDFENILYCQADGNYTIVFLIDGSKIVTSTCLKHLTKQLDSFNFVRIHQSYVISKNMLSIIFNAQVELFGGMRLPLSRRYRKRILTLLSI